MMNIAENFLSETERRQVEGRIAGAEERTSGEIVVMIAPSSYHYPYAGLLGSSLLSILVSVAVSMLLEKESMWFFLSAFVLTFMLMHEIFRRILFLKRPFISSRDIAVEVEEAAVMAFYRSGVNRTAEHTGILLYISLYERRVRVIADQGINERVDQSVWQEIAGIVSGGFRDKQHARSLGTAVDRCGDILAEHFPRKAGDINELSNTVIIGGEGR
jgi:putative membrane protein